MRTVDFSFYLFVDGIKVFLCYGSFDGCLDRSQILYGEIVFLDVFFGHFSLTLCFAELLVVLLSISRCVEGRVEIDRDD